MSAVVSDKPRTVTKHLKPDYYARLNDLVQARANDTISEREMFEIRSVLRRRRTSMLTRLTDALFPSIGS